MNRPWACPRGLLAFALLRVFDDMSSAEAVEPLGQAQAGLVNSSCWANCSPTPCGSDDAMFLRKCRRIQILRPTRGRATDLADSRTSLPCKPRGWILSQWTQRSTIDFHKLSRQRAPHSIQPQSWTCRTRPRAADFTVRRRMRGRTRRSHAYRRASAFARHSDLGTA